MTTKSIILNTYEYVRELRERTAYVRRIEGQHFIVDILRDTIDCLQFAHKAYAELHAYSREIASGNFQYGYSYIEPSIADLVFNLGESCFQQLRLARAYLPDGRLPFFYYAVQNPHFNDVLLIRANNELT